MATFSIKVHLLERLTSGVRSAGFGNPAGAREEFRNPAGADEEFRILDDKKKGKLGEEQSAQFP